MTEFRCCKHRIIIKKNYIGAVILSPNGKVTIQGGLFEKTMFETAKNHTRQCWARNYNDPVGVSLSLNDSHEWVWCLGGGLFRYCVQPWRSPCSGAKVFIQAISL